MLWIIEDIETLDPEAVLRFLPILSEPRRTRVLAMKHVPAQVQSTAAELLLRFALREEYGLTALPRIEIGEKGKPFFPDRPEIQFNLSHCKTAVACALDRAPLGVDVQEIRPFSGGAQKNVPPAGKSTPICAPTTGEAAAEEKPPAIYRVLSEPERAWVEIGLTRAERDRRFTAIWTCKEAYGKATGVGFLYDLRSTEFRPKIRPWQQYGMTFRFCDLGDTMMTLCAEQSLRLRRVRFARLRSCFSEEII